MNIYASYFIGRFFPRFCITLYKSAKADEEYFFASACDGIITDFKKAAFNKGSFILSDSRADVKIGDPYVLSILIEPHNLVLSCDEDFREKIKCLESDESIHKTPFFSAELFIALKEKALAEKSIIRMREFLKENSNPQHEIDEIVGFYEEDVNKL